MIGPTSLFLPLGTSGSAFVRCLPRKVPVPHLKSPPISASTATSSTSLGIPPASDPNDVSRQVSAFRPLSAQGSASNEVRASTGPSEKQKQGTKRRGKWNAEEQSRFLEAMDMYGNDWKRARAHINTRTAAQIRSHSQKYYQHLRKKEIRKARNDPRYRNAIFVITHEYWHITPPSPSPRPLFKPSRIRSSVPTEDCRDRLPTTPSLGVTQAQEIPDDLAFARPHPPQTEYNTLPSEVSSCPPVPGPSLATSKQHVLSEIQYRQ